MNSEPMLTDRKFAFVELCKAFLGYTSIPGEAAGFVPRYDDEIVCLDMVLGFPDEIIEEYIGKSLPLRYLAWAVVGAFWDRENWLTDPDNYAINDKIDEYVQKWKKELGTG